MIKSFFKNFWRWYGIFATLIILDDWDRATSAGTASFIGYIFLLSITIFIALEMWVSYFIGKLESSQRKFINVISK